MSEQQQSTPDLSMPELSQHSPVASETTLTLSQSKMLERQLDIELARLRIMEIEKSIELERLKGSNAKTESSVDDNSKASSPPNRTKPTPDVSIPIDLPKRELQRFSGEPKMYWSFMKEFQSTVESKTADGAIRLTYLIQYCEGKAKEAIRHCTILDDDIGYSTAISILKRNFGQNYMVARAYIDDLVDGTLLVDGNTEALQSLAQDMSICEATLRQLGYDSDMNSSRTIENIVKRLPLRLRHQWAEIASSIMKRGQEPLFRDLAEFIQDRAEVASTRFGQLASPKPTPLKRTLEQRSTVARLNVNAAQSSRSVDLSTSTCCLCDGSHRVDQCSAFLQNPVSSRYDIVRKHKMCIVCLKLNHIAKNCRSPIGCTIEGCGRRHHRLLHMDAIHQSEDNMTNHTVHSNAVQSVTPNVGLAVLPVIIYNGNRSVKGCAFLDNGSDSSFILDTVAEELGLDGEETQLSLTTLNGRINCHSRKVTFDIQGIDSNVLVHVRRAWVVNSLPQINQAIPNDNQLRSWTHLRNVPVHPTETSQVSILLGCDVPEAHHFLNQIRGELYDPFAVQTVLGWTILGPLNNATVRQSSTHFLHVNEIESSLAKFYDQDVVDSGDNGEHEMSVEDRQALDTMHSSVVLRNHHYEVALPWCHENHSLPDNLSLAMHRLLQLKRRLKQNPGLHRKYTEVMNDYIQQGHAELNPNVDGALPGWYLPHHPVFHPMKPNKLRIVFDCAAQYQGRSLNKELLSGPNLNNSLVGVLLRFRRERYAVMADIQSMFHQVLVPENDRSVLQFLWWPNGDLELKPLTYRMCVHLFGATSSPSCAAFALKRTIADHAQAFDADVVAEANLCFYVDDCLLSIASIEDARRYIVQLKGMLIRGGFNLTKWISNEPSLMACIPEGDRVVQCVEFNKTHEPALQRTLGLIWDVTADAYKFSAKPMTRTYTRRNILSYVASFFDPLGFISPVILIAKSVLQRLCRQRFDWDDLITGEEQKLWKKWLDSIPYIERISLPRCIKDKSADPSVIFHLHVFSDASETGYGAVAYLLLIGAVKSCRLLLSKGRVAPLSSNSIPRLELAAAVIAVKLANLIRNELHVKMETTTFWTDSLIVLQSIQNRSKRFPTYFANRLQLIHQLSTPNEWRYVDTKQNPADPLSRGIFPDESQKLTRWLNGPEYLLKEMIHWPQFPTRLIEEPSSINHIHSNVSDTPYTILSRLSHVSSWTKLQRIVAYVLRIKSRFLKRPSSGDIALTNIELSEASSAIIKLIQATAFDKEMHFLTQTTALPSTKTNKTARLRKYSSPLHKLNPLIHDGFIRVGGRLQHSHLPFETKHPLILPSDHFVSRLIIKHYHLINGHMGLSSVLAAVRERYWILRATRTIKSVLNDCHKCRRWFSSPCKQMMASLPQDRVLENVTPFTSTGVDYFGPLYVRRCRAVEKRYGCLFTCLSTRAVHIEISHTLDSDSFLCAFSRFVARRGVPERIYSDNGSNFKGAEVTIKGLLDGWNQEHLSSTLASRGCSWVFSPPKASHWGGIWERLIRIIKRILLITLEEQLINDEILHTTMIEIEKILNDRPLVKQTDDPDDQYVLTPSKLLLLRGNPSIPIPQGVKATRFSRRWRQAQYLADIFWRKWTKSYLPTLQIIHRWIKKEANLEVGSLVLLVDNNAPRGQWQRGVVEEVKQDYDGLVREVRVRTTAGIFRRDVRQICKLEGDILLTEQASSCHTALSARGEC